MIEDHAVIRATSRALHDSVSAMLNHVPIVRYVDGVAVPEGFRVGYITAEHVANLERMARAIFHAALVTSGLAQAIDISVDREPIWLGGDRYLVKIVSRVTAHKVAA